MSKNRNQARRQAAGAEPPTSEVVGDVNALKEAVQQSNSRSSLLSFVAPTEIVDLPSAGLFYPKGHPLHGKDTLEIKYMTAKEEDILTSPSLLRKGVAIDRMLESLIIDKDVGVEDLLVGDRSALMFAARITGYGAEYPATMDCPSCEEEFDTIFDLTAYSNCYTTPNPKDSKFPYDERASTFAVTLPKSGVLVNIRLLLGVDENKLNKTKEMKSRNGLPESNLTDMLKQIIVSANGVDNREEINMFVDNMPAIDSKYLRAAYTSVMPNVTLSNAVECPHCGFETETEVPITAEFFWPEQ